MLSNLFSDTDPLPMLSIAFERVLREAFPEFTDTEKVTASRAAEEAIEAVSGLVFHDLPWIGVTDDGVVMLQWERDNEGIGLFFSGDGTFSFAVKTGPTDHYATGYTEQATKQGIPAPICSEVLRLSRGVGAP